MSVVFQRPLTVPYHIPHVSKCQGSAGRLWNSQTLTSPLFCGPIQHAQCGLCSPHSNPLCPNSLARHQRDGVQENCPWKMFANGQPRPFTSRHQHIWLSSAIIMVVWQIFTPVSTRSGGYINRFRSSVPKGVFYLVFNFINVIWTTRYWHILDP